MRDTRHRVPRLGLTAVAICRALVRDIFDPYRPELHYMRGPGPKWRAKHGIAEPHTAATIARPLPVRG